MEYQIFTGTQIKINRGFMKSSFKLMYCGMSDENTFVIAPLITVGYQGFSPNIYYPKDLPVIRVDQLDFDVLEVTPDYIVLGD